MRNTGTVSPEASSGPKLRSKLITTRVTITALGRQGDGVAPGPVFVRRGLPGETVEGDLVGSRLENARIVEPSDNRVSPVCRHFKTCGGCQLQHGSEALVASWKREIVVSALSDAGVDANVLEDVKTSPERSRRRAKFSARRTKSGAMAGFHARASGTLVDILDCPVSHPELQKGLALVRELARTGSSRKAEIDAHCTVTASGLDVAITGGKPLDAGLMRDLPRIVSEFGCARLTWGGELVAQVDTPLHRVGNAKVPLPPGAFLQATAHGELVLQSCVRDALPGATRIADLFAGCGTFALDLADLAPVWAFESEQTMVTALQEAANGSSLTYPVTARRRDLFRDPLTEQELSGFDGIVLDPPRAGAAAQVARIAQSGVRQVAFVSCDPVTFARDAATLAAAGYVAEWVQVVDQFRWSPHVELAARFVLSDT